MIICAGEAIIDMLPRSISEPLGAEPGYLPVAGGASFNTAIALAHLDQQASLFCPLSNDVFGQKLAATAQAAGVNINLSPRVDWPTTLAFVALSEGVASYFFYDNDSAMRRLTSDELPPLPRDVTAFHIGGIALVPEPCGTAFEEFTRRASETCPVSFDPNIRPAFVEDPVAYRNRMSRMFDLADIIKISEEDIDWLHPGLSLEEFAVQRVQNGAKLVLTTLGSDGAEAHTKSAKVHVSSPIVSVIDTVGAGDTFNAGLLTALNEGGHLTKEGLDTLREPELEQALSLAINAAAISVTRAGANPPFRNEI